MHVHAPPPLIVGLLIAAGLLMVALYASGAIGLFGEHPDNHAPEGDDG